MRGITFAFALIVLLISLRASSAQGSDIYDRVEHHTADSDGVEIHYVTAGEGPVVLFIHGFPDIWYTWRHQMTALVDDFKVVAMDQRGYNRSGRPKGVENYDFKLLVGDVAAVVRDLGVEKATIVGHDWGGSVAWRFIMTHPEMADGLVIFNRPHPR